MLATDSPAEAARSTNLMKEPNYAQEKLRRAPMVFETVVSDPQSVGRVLTDRSGCGWEYYEIIPYTDLNRPKFLLVFLQRQPETREETPDATP